MTMTPIILVGLGFGLQATEEFATQMLHCNTLSHVTIYWYVTCHCHHNSYFIIHVCNVDNTAIFMNMSCDVN